MSQHTNRTRRAARPSAPSRSPATILAAVPQTTQRRKGVTTMHTITIDERLYAEIVRASEEVGTTVEAFAAEWLQSGVDALKPTLGIPQAR